MYVYRLYTVLECCRVLENVYILKHMCKNIDVRTKSRSVPETADALIAADSRTTRLLPSDIKVFGDSPQTLQKSWKILPDI